jgi:serine protease SohB
MRSQRRFVVLVTLVLLLFCSFHVTRARRDDESAVHENSDDDDEDSGDSDAEDGSIRPIVEASDSDGDDDVVQVNPGYEGPSNRSSQPMDVGAKEEGKESEDTKLNHEQSEDGASSKSAIGKALKASKQTPSRSASVRRRTSLFLRRHGFKITLALALYAFRKELRLLAWRVLTKPVRDPKTGEWVRHPVPVSVTDILKIVIFVDVMRRLQQSDASDNGTSSNKAPPLAALLLAGGAGRGNPFMAMFLSKLLEPSNSAYVPPVEQHYTFERINNRYNRDADALRKVLAATPGSPRSAAAASTTASHQSWLATSQRRPALHLFGDHYRRSPVISPSTAAPKAPREYRETIIVLDWTGLDTSVSQLSTLRDQVSFLLSQYRNETWSDPPTASPYTSLSTLVTTPLQEANETSRKLNTSFETAAEPSMMPAAVATPPSPTAAIGDVEILVLLESPGGSAGDYGLAAQQMLRLRRSGLRVTVCVDKVAASGGYMIASCASPGRLLAAPLAVVGSIGVVGQSVNIHNTLKKYGVEPLVFRGGRDKAPVGLIGEVTREGMQKVQSIVDNTHRAFKRHVVEARPILADKIEELATGDIWLGYDALEVGLVDRLVTSDEYLEERLGAGARVLKLTRLVKPRYPFARPTTTTQEIHDSLGPLGVSSSILGEWLLQALARGKQQVVEQISDWLTDLVSVGDDPIGIARAMATASAKCSPCGKRRGEASVSILPDLSLL